MEPASHIKRSAFLVRLSKTQPTKTTRIYENALVQIILMITLFECQTCLTEPRFSSNLGDWCLSDFVLSCLRYFWFYLSLSFVLRLSHDPISCFYYHRAKVKAVCPVLGKPCVFAHAKRARLKRTVDTSLCQVLKCSSSHSIFFQFNR